MRATLRLAAPLLLPLFLAPAFGRAIPKAKPEEVGLSSERLGRIHAFLADLIERRQIAGAVTLVARRGRVAHFEAQGMMDIGSARPVRPDTIFRIASMTKPLTSAAVMMLYEQGRFHLTDPVSRFIPEFRQPQVAVAVEPGERRPGPFKLVPADREITIRDLLTHTAGLANRSTGITRDVAAKAFASRSKDETAGDFTRRLAKLPLNFQPGTAWEYGAATDVLGCLVEVISGQTLDEYFRQHIYQPLEMRDTHFYVPEEKVERLSQLYVSDGKGELKPAPARPLGMTWTGTGRFFSGAGGLCSTAEDYFRFCQMLLNGGELDDARLLSRKSIELMTSNHIGDLPIWPHLRGYRFGLGFRVRTDVGASGMIGSVGEYGWDGAFGTHFWIDPKEQMVGIFMVQLLAPEQISLSIRRGVQVLATQAIVD